MQSKSFSEDSQRLNYPSNKQQPLDHAAGS